VGYNAPNDFYRSGYQFAQAYERGNWAIAGSGAVDFVQGTLGALPLTALGSMTRSVGASAGSIPISARSTNTLAVKEGASFTSAASIRTRVLENIAESKAARASSNFNAFIKIEGQLQAELKIWPPNRGGYYSVPDIILDKGMMLDRYGNMDGSFLSPINTPFESRALPPSYRNRPLLQYEVIKPIPGVTQSKVLPWFGQQGMGTQFELPLPVRWYLDNEYLKEIIK
jgi:filamentous hemagglutinin